MTTHTNLSANTDIITPQPSLRSRYQGALLGLACGDAVGTTVEFSRRGTFTPLTDMVGGGPFALRPGQWTDDTSMALCLAESLLTQNDFDAADQMQRYVSWWRHGHLSSTGRCFDIGITVRSALSRFETSGEPFSGSTDPYSAGNGSLMRLTPVVLFAYPDADTVLSYAAESSRTTHGAPEAVESCQLFAALLCAVLAGCEKDRLFDQLRYTPTQVKIIDIASGNFIGKRKQDVNGTGYCVPSLEAALWCFLHTDSFKEAILCAANLGDDADTTAAITGQLAGAYYGIEGIPDSWLERLAMRDKIEGMANELHDQTSRTNY